MAEKKKEGPLRTATTAGKLARVQALVAKGTDVNETNASGLTPVSSAAKRGHWEIARWLVRHGATGTTALHTAVEKGDLATVRSLIENGVNKDAIDGRGETALMRATASGKHTDIAEYLLEQGCDRDHASNNRGWTALHRAAIFGRLEVAQLLMRYGARLDIRDCGGQLPIDLAVRYDCPNIADAIRAEEIRRRDHGFKRDRSTIPGTEEYEAAKRPRVEGRQEEEKAVKESADNDDDDDDDDDDNDDDDDEDDDEDA